MSDNFEALFTGRKGDKGDTGPAGQKGDAGEKGRSLPPSIRRAIVYLCLLSLLLSGVGLFWSSHEVHVNQAAQRTEQAQQRKQGERTLTLLCTTFGELAANKPPPGNPQTNPSRAYDDRQHVILDQLGADLGCQ